MADSILAPEINLIKNDEFYALYEMMMQALKTDNVKEGVNKSLALLRTFLNSGNIALYKKNTDGLYIFQVSDTPLNDLSKPISCIVNKTKELTRQKNIFKLDLNLERLNNIVLLNTNISDNDYIVIVINPDKSKDLESQFWERARETIQIILKRAVSYEKNIAAISTDLLTGLDNRNSYEMRLQNMNEADEKLILGIFDLFRLKYINDNYTHAKGDEYIRKAAKILNKYWPKQNITLNDDLTENYVDTGHCIYRIGGDEFVLLTDVESLHLASVKAELAIDEAAMLDLGVSEDMPLGLNYGLVKHNSGDSLKQTFMRADEIMQQDKARMYKKHNLDRRR